MPLKRWAHSASINYYGKARPVRRIILPAALVAAVRAAGSPREMMSRATDAVVLQRKPQR
jgi:hypothetical protein